MIKGPKWKNLGFGERYDVVKSLGIWVRRAMNLFGYTGLFFRSTKPSELMDLELLKKVGYEVPDPADPDSGSFLKAQLLGPEITWEDFNFEEMSYEEYKEEKSKNERSHNETR